MRPNCSPTTISTIHTFLASSIGPLKLMRSSVYLRLGALAAAVEVVMSVLNQAGWAGGRYMGIMFEGRECWARGCGWWLMDECTLMAVAAVVPNVHGTVHVAPNPYSEAVDADQLTDDRLRLLGVVPAGGGVGSVGGLRIRVSGLWFRVSRGATAAMPWRPRRARRLACSFSLTTLS